MTSLRIRGQRHVVSRETMGANVLCTLSCGHTITRKRAEANRPTALCASCRNDPQAMSSTARNERYQRIKRSRAVPSGSEGSRG